MLITLDRSDTPCAHMMLIFVHRDDDIIMILLKHSLLWCILALSMVVYLHSLWLCTCTLYGGVLALYGGVLALSMVVYLYSVLWCTCTLCSIFGISGLLCAFGISLRCVLKYNQQTRMPTAKGIYI